MKAIVFVAAVFCGVIALGSSQTVSTQNTVTQTSAETKGSPTTATTPGDTVHTTGQTPTSPETTVSPTPAPGSETKNDYEYFKNKVVCLKARFSAHFQKDKRVWNVSDDAKVDNDTSGCGILSVMFKTGTFQINFNQTSKNAFYINSVYANLNDNKKVVAVKAENLTVAKAANGSSYMCASGVTIDMSGNVTLNMKDFQVQAYYVKDGKFATAVKCDSDLSPLVPIIVGAVLAGLVLVVVVAYFIGRNRNRVGYEEI